MIVIEIFFAIFKATIEAGMELSRKNFLWAIFIVAGALMLIGWFVVAANYPLAQWIVYTKYLCGVYVIAMIGVLYTWFKWWSAGKQVFDIDWDA